MAVLLAVIGCGDDDSGSSSEETSAQADAGVDATTTQDAAQTDSAVATSACASETTQQARVACAANALLDSLDSTQKASVNFALSDYVTRSKWSNFPVQMNPRAGLQYQSLGSASQTALLQLLAIALSDSGNAELTGVLRADDYLKTMQQGYGSELYSVAIFGTPAASSDFEVMFGGHHMAYNLSFVSNAFYPIPMHLGAEPKDAFTVNNGTYAPLVAMGDAMFAIYDALDTSQQTGSYLSGQSFSDVVVSPSLDYGKGSARTSPSAYPTGTNRKGVLVSSMTSAQQALVTAAVEQWVRQLPSEVADGLMSAYTGSYDDTLFAWAGESSGPDQDVSGSYLRIDGPRLWIELAVQGGVVIRNATHYHTIYRDKTYDYGGQF